MVGRLLRALLAAVLLAVGVVAVPGTAHARTDYLDVEITSISNPTLNLSDPDQVIEIRGRLTNVSTTPIRYVNVHFWRAPVAITTPREFTEISTNVTTGNRLFEEAAGNLHILTREQPFGPGERAEFQVRATVAELITAGPSQPPLPRDDAAYLLGVHVRGIPEDAQNMLVGRAQVAIAATQRPVTSSALVTLTAAPTWLPDGTFLDDSLSDELVGRLETLLSAAERPGVITAIDPALYRAVRQLSGEHTVGVETREGSGVALRWAERINVLAEENRLWRLPFGNPDLIRADVSGELHRVLAWAREALPDDLSELPSVALLDDGARDGLIPNLAEFDTVVIRNATGGTEGPPRVVTSAPEEPGDPLPAGVRPARRIVDELLAPRTLLYVIETPAEAAADKLLAPYREHVPISGGREAPLRWVAAPDPPPMPTLIQSLEDEAANADLMADLTPDPPPFDMATIGATAFSKGFINETASINYVGAASPADIDLTKIMLRTAANYVMSSPTNEFPATLTNELDIPVTVGVQFDTDAPQRIRVPAVEAVLVPAQSTVNITITPEAAANGVALVYPMLVTAEGIELRPGEPIEIAATDLGRVGWIIIVISGAVVLGGTAWRISAVRREAAQKVEKVEQ